MTDQAIARLIQTAQALVGEFNLGYNNTAGSVAAAVMGASGRIYTGICLELDCGIGLCAEAAAVAEMLKSRETRIAAVAAVNSHGVISPCGRCREMLIQIDPLNRDCIVVLAGGRAKRLSELLPEYWRD